MIVICLVLFDPLLIIVELTYILVTDDTGGIGLIPKGL